LTILPTDNKMTIEMKFQLISYLELTNNDIGPMIGGRAIITLGK